MQLRKARARERARDVPNAHGAPAADGDPAHGDAEGALAEGHVFLADGLPVGSAAGLGPGAVAVRRLKRGPLFGARETEDEVLHTSARTRTRTRTLSLTPTLTLSRCSTTCRSSSHRTARRSTPSSATAASPAAARASSTRRRDT